MCPAGAPGLKCLWCWCSRRWRPPPAGGEKGWLQETPAAVWGPHLPAPRSARRAAGEEQRTVAPAMVAASTTPTSGAGVLPSCSHSEAEALGPTGRESPHTSVPSCCCGVGAVEVGGVSPESQGSSWTWGLLEDSLEEVVSVSAGARARSRGALTLLLRL